MTAELVRHHLASRRAQVEQAGGPVCGEPADASRFFRCQKDAGHNGDRHHVDFGVGSYTWGYVPTPTEVQS